MGLSTKSYFSKKNIKKPIDKCFGLCYNVKVARNAAQKWPLSQAAKTSPSHGEGMGSIPVGVTKQKVLQTRSTFFVCNPLSVKEARKLPSTRGGGTVQFAPPLAADFELRFVS